MLPALATLAGSDTLTLESISFDPDLPDPEESNGRFNTGHPDFPYMRQVVQDAINRDVAAVPPVLPTPTPSPSASSTATPDEGPTSVLPPARAVPTSVAASCELSKRGTLVTRLTGGLPASAVWGRWWLYPCSQSGSESTRWALESNTRA